MSRLERPPADGNLVSQTGGTSPSRTADYDKYRSERMRLECSVGALNRLAMTASAGGRARRRAARCLRTRELRATGDFEQAAETVVPERTEVREG